MYPKVSGNSNLIVDQFQIMYIYAGSRVRILSNPECFIIDTWLVYIRLDIKFYDLENYYLTNKILNEVKILRVFGVPPTEKGWEPLPWDITLDNLGYTN